jgi:hypothetical protein
MFFEKFKSKDKNVSWSRALCHIAGLQYLDANPAPGKYFDTALSLAARASTLLTPWLKVYFF